ncbi:hypothetical protein ABIB25_003124 [Nakamurella sp. UYEF19]|uniref:efflux RND transporter periplasmic adaptor subunit n=1 Tax=Nakamurella sp. UYEF19 TaxID=1756392 RepID=UPI0033970A48
MSVTRSMQDAIEDVVVGRGNTLVAAQAAYDELEVSTPGTTASSTTASSTTASSAPASSAPASSTTASSTTARSAPVSTSTSLAPAAALSQCQAAVAQVLKDQTELADLESTQQKNLVTLDKLLDLGTTGTGTGRGGSSAPTTSGLAPTSTSSRGGSGAGNGSGTGTGSGSGTSSGTSSGTGTGTGNTSGTGSGTRSGSGAGTGTGTSGSTSAAAGAGSVSGSGSGGSAGSGSGSGSGSSSGTGTSTGTGTGTGIAGSGGSASNPQGSGGAAANGGQSGRTPTAADIAADQAQIDLDEANISVVAQNLKAATLTSPIAGTVASVSMTAGTAVGANSTTSVITILGPGQYQVSTTISLALIDQLEVGDKTAVTVNGITDSIPGKVTYVGILSSSATSGTTTYPVTVLLDPSAQTLYQGAGASVAITLAQVANVLTVPTSAVHTSGNVHSVSVLTNGQLESVAVEVGAIGTDLTEITSGLEAGQQVAIANLDQPMATPSSSSAAGLLGGSGNANTGNGAGGFTRPGAGANRPGG